MPSLATVKASNASYAPSYIPTAVFVGGTSGIGQAMAELLARQLNGRVNIILIGRSKAAADKIIAGFPTPPGEVKHEFIQCDASELKNVHEVSQTLLHRLEKINFLVLSPVSNSFSAVPTSEGLELAMVLRYYARAKFLYELLPLLKNARAKGEEGRAMTVLGAAMGGKVDMNDLGLKKKWSIIRLAFQTGTYTDIMIKVQWAFGHLGNHGIEHSPGTERETPRHCIHTYVPGYGRYSCVELSLVHEDAPSYHQTLRLYSRGLR